MRSCRSITDRHWQLPKSLTPLFEHLGVCVPEEVLNSTLCYYSGANNPVQHIRHFRNKIVVYSRNNLLVCLTFPSNLKDVISD